MTSATTYSRTAAKYTEAPLFICGAKSPLESRLWTRLTGKISPARFDWETGLLYSLRSFFLFGAASWGVEVASSSSLVSSLAVLDSSAASESSSDSESDSGCVTDDAWDVPRVDVPLDPLLEVKFDTRLEVEFDTRLEVEFDPRLDASTDPRFDVDKSDNGSPLELDLELDPRFDEDKSDNGSPLECSSEKDDVGEELEGAFFTFLVLAIDDSDQ